MSQLSSQLKSLGSLALPVAEAVSSYYSLLSLEHERLAEMTSYTDEMLDKVYHSESMHEMQVNADLYGIDLCNPYVLFFLAKTTTYHHAFWSHTRKRFLAFKSILRRDKRVRESLRDGILLKMLAKHVDVVRHDIMNDRVYNTPGSKQELKNWEQVLNIVEKAATKRKGDK